MPSEEVREKLYIERLKERGKESGRNEASDQAKV